MRRGRPLLTLIGTASLLFVAMLSSFTPTPLYSTYQRLWALDEARVGLIFAAYSAGVLVVLLFLGGISDRIGRLVTLRLGAVALAAGLALLAFAPSLPWLVMGRLVQGLASGLITGAGAAALMETHPRGLRRGSNLNTSILACGFALGPLLAAQISTRLPHPLVLPYVAVAMLLLVPSTLLATVRRTSPAQTLPAHWIKPVQVPRRLRAPFAVAAGSIVMTNICLSIVGTFGPDIALAVGWRSSAAAGILVSGVLTVQFVAQIVGRRIGAVSGMLAGGACLIMGWGLITVGIFVPSPGLVVPGAIALGAGAGLGLLCSAVHVGHIAPSDRRAEVYSAYLVTAFLGLAMTSLGLGPVIDAWGIASATATALAISALILTAMTITLARQTSRQFGPQS